MPVYMRKNQRFTPSSIGDLTGVDDSLDYLQDPDQLRDKLPQPYRMINKVLLTLFDDTWEIISSREEDRVKEATRIKPPQYECGVQVQSHGQATCLTDSRDGRYIFVGLPDGLAVLSAVDQQTVVQWEEEKVEITNIHVSYIPDHMYILCTVDDMGIGRLFIFALDKIFLVKVLNESDENKKTIAHKCEASKEGEYVGISLENTATQECYLELYKSPKDQWVKDVEEMQARAAAKFSKHATPQPEGESAAEETVEPSGGDDLESDKRSQSPGSPRGVTPSGDRPAHKFLPPNMVAKISAPKPLTGSAVSSPYQAFKSVDTGDVIGSGFNHLLTKDHLQQRNNLFRNLHEPLLKYLPKQEKKRLQLPTWHFLSPGRVLPHGLEQPNLLHSPTAIAVWWTGGTHLVHYSLIKNIKDDDEDEEDKPPPDLELKPELVWPQSCAITSSTITPCSSLIALALENGNIVVWDKYIGVERCVVSVSDTALITELKFLNPNICNQESGDCRPYGTRINVYLLACCNDGEISMVNCGPGANSQPVEICERSQNDNEMFTAVKTLEGVPEVIVTAHNNGCLFIKDILNGKVLCEITLPKTHHLTSPWEPLIASGCNGMMLYIKGSEKEPTVKDPVEKSEPPGAGLLRPDMNQNVAPVVDNCPHNLFVFQLRSFPTLERYWKRQREELPYVIHSTVEKRVDALLQERLNQQSLRQMRMQERWEHLSEELESSEQIQENSSRISNIIVTQRESSVRESLSSSRYHKKIKHYSRQDSNNNLESRISRTVPSGQSLQ